MPLLKSKWRLESAIEVKTDQSSNKTLIQNKQVKDYIQTIINEDYMENINTKKTSKGLMFHGK